ncbi:MAG: hypothetical protein EPO62_07780 [Candidatus Nitrosotenuis sp.]|nr:MAG: hypothetical protein EPO62_07780 [Candidatus Nitrosotenuis sp.]
MIGLLGTGLPLIYSVVIAVAIYVGIKVFVGKRKQSLAKHLGQGICADCGSKLEGGKCHTCDANWRNDK